jgi:opacity protein-like surface antigen
MRHAVHVFVALGLLHAVCAQAQDDETSRKPSLTRYEITPFVAYRIGGDFDVRDSDRDADVDDHMSFALAANLRLDEVSQYELFYSRQATQLAADSPPGALDINVEYLHLGGTLTLNEEHWLRPYIAGGLGITRFSADAAGASDDARFSLSLAGGLRVPVSERFGVRLEARGYLTFIDTDSAVFCASGAFGGVCSIRGKGSAFVQYEVLAGAAFAF